MDESIYIRSQDCIAQEALTNSKRPASFVRGVYPTHLSHGLGCYVWDTQGNKYIDYICGLGSNLLGYANETITSRVCKELESGSNLSLASPVEVSAAEKLKECIPWVTHMKFLKTGSEACTAAVRIARAHTNRKLVYTEGYHGWHDEFVSIMPNSVGTIASGYTNTYLPIDDAYAAVIVEPIMTDTSPGRIEHLKYLRDQCDRTGAVLIFDEVITGFRYPKWTVSNYYNIRPDLIILGKSIAGGMPLSVVAGNSAIMNGSEYFVSSTFAGDRTALGAMEQTIDLMRSHKFDINYLWKEGQKFLDKFNALSDKIKIEGYPTRGVFKGDEMFKALFFQECCKAGILLGASWFFCFPHIEHSVSVLGTMRDVVNRINTGMVKLEGEMPRSPFAQKVREKC